MAKMETEIKKIIKESYSRDEIVSRVEETFGDAGMNYLFNHKNSLNKLGATSNKTKKPETTKATPVQKNKGKKLSKKEVEKRIMEITGQTTKPTQGQIDTYYLTESWKNNESNSTTTSSRGIGNTSDKPS